MLLQFKGSKTLLCSTLSVLQVLSMLAEILIRLGRLGELSVHKLVLASECLNILNELHAFGCLCLRELSLFLKLRSQVHALSAKSFDFSLAFTKSALNGVLFASDNTNLMLNI